MRELISLPIRRIAIDLSLLKKVPEVLKVIPNFFKNPEKEFFDYVIKVVKEDKTITKEKIREMITQVEQGKTAGVHLNISYPALWAGAALLFALGMKSLPDKLESVVEKAEAHTEQVNKAIDNP